MSPDEPLSADKLDISGNKAARRKVILWTVGIALAVLWFLSPWRTLFFFAIRQDSPALVRMFLALGTDPNKPEPRGGDTPLIAALRPPCRSLDMLKLLLSKGADPNRLGGAAASTPLAMVKESCPHALAAVDTLVGAGADVKACGGWSWRDGRKCCSLMRNQKSVELAKHLLELGADPNQNCHPYELSPLDTVIRQPDMIALYLDHGAKMPVDEKTGKTMLHEMAEIGAAKGDESADRLMTAEILLERGADVNAVDAEGRTALDYANEQMDEEMIDILVKHGGKANKTEGGVQDGEDARETPEEYSQFRTFAPGVRKAAGCSLSLHGKNRSVMEAGQNLAVVKGTVAIARVYCPSSGYLHYGVLGMGPPVPKRLNMPIGAGLTPVEITFDQTWSNGEMHWYFSKGRIPNLLQAVTRGSVSQVALRYVTVGE